MTVCLCFLALTLTFYKRIHQTPFAKLGIYFKFSRNATTAEGGVRGALASVLNLTSRYSPPWENHPVTAVPQGTGAANTLVPLCICRCHTHVASMYGANTWQLHGPFWRPGCDQGICMWECSTLNSRFLEILSSTKVRELY
jgi:hypothetical protein